MRGRGDEEGRGREGTVGRGEGVVGVVGGVRGGGVRGVPGMGNASSSVGSRIYLGVAGGGAGDAGASALRDEHDGHGCNGVALLGGGGRVVQILDIGSVRRLKIC